MSRLRTPLSRAHSSRGKFMAAFLTMEDLGAEISNLLMIILVIWRRKRMKRAKELASRVLVLMMNTTSLPHIAKLTHRFPEVTYSTFTAISATRCGMKILSKTKDEAMVTIKPV
jgi:hypothetical protein